MTTTTRTLTTRRNPVTAHLLETQVPATLVLYAMYVGAVALFGAGLAIFWRVPEGLWNGALGLAQWYVLGLGAFVTAHYLPLFVAHGRTRREGAVGALAMVAVVVPLIGALFTLGFGLEAGVYHLLGWQAQLADPHPLGSLTSAVSTFGRQTVAAAGFAAIGALGGAAFYRNGLLGTALVPLGIGAIVINGALQRGADAGPPFMSELVTSSTGGALLLSVVVSTAMLAAAWPILRDLPLRSEPG